MDNEADIRERTVRLEANYIHLHEDLGKLQQSIDALTTAVASLNVSAAVSHTKIRWIAGIAGFVAGLASSILPSLAELFKH